MGKNPCIIIKEQGAKARKRRARLNSLDHERVSVLEKAEEQMNNGLIYGFYQDLMKAFMVEGYPVIRAEKHIKEWAENELIDVVWVDGFHLVGYGEDY